jgi:GT2 family glycosyltransferase
LEQCLCSVQKGIRDLDAEIIVIDNCSSDGSVDYLRPIFPLVSFLKNDANLGFGKANNKALLQAKGKYVLFLNPDTIVSEDCFINCIHFLESTATAGAAGVRMIDGRGKFLPESKRSFPSPLSSFYKLTGLAFLFPRSKIFNRYALGNLDEYQIHEIDVLAGAFMMIKKEVLEKIKGFDESFFMYGEDIDLSYRIQQAGYTIFYLGENTIIHFKGESSKKQNINYVSMFYNAMTIFVNKHYNKLITIVFFIVIKMALIIRSLFMFLGHLINIKKKSILSLSQTIIIGSFEEQQQVRAVLHKLEATALKGVEPDAFADFIKAQPSDHKKIIFCEGVLSYREIISHIQSHPNFVFRFHSNKSNSIVGSDSKNGIGETIAL